MPNRLAQETSPYLLQHKDNPVDWHPWGTTALEKAKTEDKPIFLSIGYAACHWCHVMEHESFEDPAIAALMNDLFVNIKVDREERPDLDSIYMNAVVALTGHGGWPMSVFLTPDGVPFYGGTYYPPRPARGMPSFPQVLRGVAEAWRDRRDDVLKGGQDVLRHIRQNELVGLGGRPEALTRQTVQEAVQTLWRQFDWRQAGWGGAPKFPQPMTIEFLLRAHVLNGESTPLEMATKTLTRMARGGMYDQLGGGFHRYSVDAQWLVPHFEKMLYDNAQLARVYTHAWQLTGEPEFQATAEAVLDYVLREMTDAAGGFYSSQDADSEGHEGKYFVWSEAEIDGVLGEAAQLFKEAYGATASGNFEGQNILFAANQPAALAEKHGMTENAVREGLEAARQKLLAVREQRVKPGLDDKVLAAWNGLMLAALADGAKALGGSPKGAAYREAAVKNAEFVLGTLLRPDGRLHRSWRQGQARLDGFLEDYTHAAEGLLATYELTFDARYYTAARELMDFVLEHFADPQGGFFDTSDEHESLVTRPKDIQDNATPAGNSMAATVMLKLAALSGETRFAETAEAALRSVQPALAQYPTAFGQWLTALCFAVGEPREVALVGDPEEADTGALLRVTREGYRPFQVVALQVPGEDTPVPLLAGRAKVDGAATAYVCFNFACRLPVTEPAALREQLQSTPAAGA